MWTDCGTGLDEAGVSVTCEVMYRGETLWWLTRESGRVPGRCCGACGRCGEEQEGSFIRPVAYVVLKGTFHIDSGLCRDVAFARMSGVAVQAIREFVSEYMRDGEDESERMRRTTEVMWKLEAGLFSGGARCVCDPLRGVCDGCKVLPLISRRFVVQQRFLGVYPRGMRHWWSGITDAVGEADRFGRLWLPRTLHSRGVWNTDRRYDGCEFCFGAADVDTPACLRVEVGRCRVTG